MSLEQFKNRNVGTQNYKVLDVGQTPVTAMEKFTQVVKRTFKGELLVGLGVTMKAMLKALFKGDMHTVKYPFEKLPISPRYRAIHDMLRLLESGHYRCIGCGLCVSTCPTESIKLIRKDPEEIVTPPKDEMEWFETENVAFISATAAKFASKELAQLEEAQPWIHRRPPVTV